MAIFVCLLLIAGCRMPFSETCCTPKGILVVCGLFSDIMMSKDAL